MREIEPKYPWCTGVPRPTLITNLDVEEAYIFYFTAPICLPQCKMAVLKLKGIVQIESHYVNDEENSYLQAGLMRDVIYVKEGAKKNEYLFLFHNEWIQATASALEEVPGADGLLENLQTHIHSDFERE